MLINYKFLCVSKVAGKQQLKEVTCRAVHWATQVKIFVSNNQAFKILFPKVSIWKLFAFFLC